MGDAQVCVSVIVPVYNQKRFLDGCLKSLSAQEGDDIEFLLIDDGSTDESPAILDEYAAREKRAKVFHTKNAGVSSARNFGLDNATGRWICFLDSDDILNERFIKRVKPFLTDTRDIVYYSWGRFARDDASDIVEDLPSGTHECTKDELRLICQTTLCPAQALAKTAMRFRGSVGVLGFLARRDIINDMGLRFPKGVKLSEDSAFRLMYNSRCQNAMCISDVLYFYRFNGNSATTSFSESVTNDLLKTMSTMRSIVRDYYCDDEDMVARYYGMIINISRNYFAKYLFNPRCPLADAEKPAAYDAYRNLEPIAQSISKCDKSVLQSPFDALLDAMRIEDAAKSMSQARLALAPKKSLRSLADKIGILPALKRILRRFK